MRTQKLNLEQPVETIDTDEARMRLALGLTTRPTPAPSSQSSPPSPPASHDSTRQRRRFAQDGDVPVVILSRNRESEAGGENKLAALSTELREERSGRIKAERALDEANLTIQSLRTKLAHTEMAFEEKLRDERGARAQVDTLLGQAQEARKHAEMKEAEAALAVSVLERKLAEVESAYAASAKAQPQTDLFVDTPAAKPATVKAGAKARGESRKPEPRQRPTQNAEPAAQEDEDQPIEWWLPSFRAARNTSSRKKR